MLNSLQTYVAETLEAHKADYDGDMKAVLMDATQGTDTGWWSDLIYTADMLKMHGEHLSAIRQAFAEYEDATGERPRDRGNVYSLYNFMEANSKAWTWEEYQNETIPNAECALWCLRFAVEWYAHDYASRNGIEL